MVTSTNPIDVLYTQLARVEEKVDSQTQVFGLRLDSLALEVKMLHEQQCQEMHALNLTHDKDVLVLHDNDKKITVTVDSTLSDHESRLRGLERRPNGLTAKNLWAAVASIIAAFGSLVIIFSKLIGA